MVATVKLLHMLNWTSVTYVYDDQHSFSEYYIHGLVSLL